MRSTRFKLWAVAIIGLLIYWAIGTGVGFYTDLLWFQHLNFESIYWTTIWAHWGVGLLVAIPFAILVILGGRYLTAKLERHFQPPA